MSHKKRLKREKRQKAREKHHQQALQAKANKPTLNEPKQRIDVPVKTPQELELTVRNIIQAEPVKVPRPGNPKPTMRNGKPVGTRVMMPPEGGVLTQLPGFDEPYRGFPVMSVVQDVTKVKKAVKDLLFGTFKDIKNMSLLGKIKVFLARKEIISNFFLCIGAVSFLVRKNRFKPEKYSRAVREIYRVMTLAVEKEKKPGMKEKAKMMRDIVCMSLELDNAYRFRLQDFFEEIDVEKLKFTKEDMAYLNVRKDYIFKYKKDLGCPDGGVIEQHCNMNKEKVPEVNYNDLVAKFGEINRLESEGKTDELKKMGVYQYIEEIKHLTKELDARQQQAGVSFKAKAEAHTNFIDEVKKIILKGQDKQIKKDV